MQKIFLQSLLCLLTLLVSQLPSRGETLRIEGEAAGWAGHTLEFMILTDPVTLGAKQLFSLSPDEKGAFSCHVEVTEPLYCYADFGVYRGKLILVPGQNMKVALPPFRDKSFEERKNPYFEPVETWLVVETKDPMNLTNTIGRFDQHFHQVTNRYFNQIYLRQMKSYLDTVTFQLDRVFAGYADPYFRLYRMAKLKSLEADLLRNGREKTAAAFRDLAPAGFMNPGVTAFLNRLFVNTLSVESKAPAGNRIKQWVGRRNTAELLAWTAGFTSVDSPLTEMLLLKMLHDAFYSGEFPKEAILEMVRSGRFTEEAGPLVGRTAREVAAKLSFLLPGSKAPVICLPEAGDGWYCSTSCTAPYQYVLFADLEVPIGREQVKYLSAMLEKTGSRVSLLLVLLPSARFDIPGFLRDNPVPGTIVMDYSNQVTGRTWQVRAYPSAFLLDREHRVVLAPARTPLDGFEFQFQGVR